VVVYALASVLFLPGMVMTLAGGALFGPVWGALINLLGATLGATAAFLVTRYLGADWVSRRLGGRLKDLVTETFPGVSGTRFRGRYTYIAFCQRLPLCVT
jgi:uncharacterized membrane protein YdjX (TVP38/TMEM64 family)